MWMQMVWGIGMADRIILGSLSTVYSTEGALPYCIQVREGIATKVEEARCLILVKEWSQSI